MTSRDHGVAPWWSGMKRASYVVRENVTTVACGMARRDQRLAQGGWGSHTTRWTDLTGRPTSAPYRDVPPSRARISPETSTSTLNPRKVSGICSITVSSGRVR